MSSPAKPSHGGARKGAGRRAKPGARVPLSCRVAPETLAALRATAAARSISLGALLDQLAASL